MIKLFYYLTWLVKCKFFKKKIPLTSSIIITDKCNLKCKHCIVANLGYKDLAFYEVKKAIKKLFQSGSRMLVITGGEPFLWKNNNYTIDDAVEYAKQLGFFRVVICTNGTFKLESKADYLWVSLDGFPEEHKVIRGDVYSQVVKNITSSSHHGIYINFTISKINFHNLENSAEYIFNLKNVKGILFHIFTPYIGSNKNLALNSDERNYSIDKLYKIKKRHPIRVSNTFSGIRTLKKDNWIRPIWSSITINQGEIGPCCCRKGIYNEDVCRNCGCTPAIETWVLERLSPLAIIENLRFL